MWPHFSKDTVGERDSEGDHGPRGAAYRSLRESLLGHHSKMAPPGPPSPRSERNWPKYGHTGHLHKENKLLETNIY